MRKGSKSSQGKKRTSKSQEDPFSGTPQGVMTAVKRRGLRVVVGVHACHEVMQVRPEAVAEAWLKKGWEHSESLLPFYENLRRQQVKISEKLPGFLDKISEGHQGVALLVEGAPDINWSAVGREDSQVFLGLDGIEDPHNLGAILRTAWLLGVEGVVTPNDRSVGLTPTVHKVACGGVEHVPVDRCTRFSVPFEEFKEKGFWIYGLSANGGRSIWETDFSAKSVLVIGSEEKGLRRTTESECDQLVHIPQISSGASYNASVAAALAMSEVFRQQR